MLPKASTREKFSRTNQFRCHRRRQGDFESKLWFAMIDSPNINFPALSLSQPDHGSSVQARVIGFELIPPCGWHFDKYLLEFHGGEIRRIETAEPVFRDLDFKRHVDIKIDAEFSSNQKIFFSTIKTLKSKNS